MIQANVENLGDPPVWIDDDDPDWRLPVDHYRVKVEEKAVEPLDNDSIPIASTLLAPDGAKLLVVEVWDGTHLTAGTRHLTYKTLALKGYMFKAPGVSDFSPCCK